MYTTNKNIAKLILYSLLGILALSLLYIFPGLKEKIDNFFILNYISLICLIILFLKKEWKKDIPSSLLIIFYILLITNTIAIIRGCLNAQSYFDWKMLFINSSGGLSVLIPLACVIGLNSFKTDKLFRFLIKFIRVSPLIFLLIIAMGIDKENFSNIIIGVIFLLLLFPYLKFSDKTIVLLTGGLSIYCAITWRTNVLHIVLSIMFSLIFYFKIFFTSSIIKILQLIAISIPLYYLYVGITTGKSIFSSDDEKEYTVAINSQGEVENLLADTRTSLYTEVLTDISSNTTTLLFGKGVGAKYRTEIFDDTAYNEGRDNVEVGLLNILLNTGIIGFIIYSLVFFSAIYVGTFKTNNTLTIIFSFFLISHWVILFLENSIIYGQYNYFTWVICGLCFSKKIRGVSDQQLKKLLHR